MQPIAAVDTRGREGRRGDLVVFAAALLFLLVALVRQLATDAPLGHDEAIYANGGRELVHGTPAHFELHRSVGMRALAAAGLLFGSGEIALRAVVLLCAAGFLLAYRALGSRAFGPWPATWAAAAMVTSFGFQRRAAEILSDVPALLLLTVLLIVVVRELGGRGEGGAPGPVLLAAAPLAAAAFYLRYGLSTSLVGVGLAAATAWWRPLATGRHIVLAALALFALLIAPHIAHSIQATGSPVGILQASGDAAHRDYVGQGLVQFPAALALEGGPILIALVIIGAAQGARCLVRVRRQRRHSRPPPEDRVVAFLWVASIFQIAVTGLTAHAEFRYFFFGVSGLTLIGAAAVCRWAAPRPRRRLAALAIVALVTTGAVTHQVNIARYTRLREARAVLVAAALELRRAAGGQPCAALTSRAPTIGWYSGCIGYPLTLRSGWLAGRRFLVRFERERDRDVARASALARSRRLIEVGRVRDPADSYGDAAIYEIR